jgi:hypothetical protein
MRCIQILMGNSEIRDHFLVVLNQAKTDAGT